MLTKTIARVQRLWRWLSRAHRFDGLPVLCGARDPSNNRPVAIWRGEMGYFLWTEGKTPEEWNNDHNISPDQVEANDKRAVCLVGMAIKANRKSAANDACLSE